MTKGKKVKKVEKKAAKARALKAFSLYIRTRDRWTCITCGKVGDKYTMDAGHLIGRYWAGTLFDELNVSCQCKSCNILHGNDYEIYRKKFISLWGIDEYERMYERSRWLVKRTADDYLHLEAFFKEKLAVLEAAL